MGASKLDGHEAVVADLKERVSKAVRVLGKMGLADYLGHASARVPGTDLFVVSPRGAMRGSLQSFRAGDMVVMDIDGNMIDGSAPPPGEFYIHSEMYRRRPEVMGGIHNHQRMTLLFGLTRREIKPLQIAFARVVSRPVPVYDSPAMICNPERGREVAEAIGDHCVCHLRGHGLMAVGNSVEEAAMNAIHLEQQAYVNYMAEQMGDPTVLSADDIDEFTTWASPAQGGGGGVGAWKYYTSLLEE